MDTSTIQLRQHSGSIAPTTKGLEGKEPAVESSSDNDQDDSQKVSGEIVKLSEQSVKLSTSSPVKSSDRAAPIVNQDEAKQALNKLIADFQSNPVQAHGSHSEVFSGAVKSLLG